MNPEDAPDRDMSQGVEDAAEMARHHHDFARISEIVERALDRGESLGDEVTVYGETLTVSVYQKALKDIRRIVG